MLGIEISYTMSIGSLIVLLVVLWGFLATRAAFRRLDARIAALLKKDTANG